MLNPNLSLLLNQKSQLLVLLPKVSSYSRINKQNKSDNSGIQIDLSQFKKKMLVFYADNGKNEENNQIKDMSSNKMYAQGVIQYKSLCTKINSEKSVGLSEASTRTSCCECKQNDLQ